MARRSLSNAVVLITGASSGIGFALAEECARRGSKLLLTARRENRLQTLVDRLKAKGSEAHFVAGDICDGCVRQELVDYCKSKFGRLDVLVNNAGIGSIGYFANGDEQRMRQIMEVNFFAPVELTRKSLPLMEAAVKPIVVNIGSVLGHWAAPQKSEYCASKFALHGFTDALNCEMRPKGVDVLLVSPSTTQTEFFDHLLEKEKGAVENPLQMSAASVAKRTARAIEFGRREVIFSVGGRAMIYLDRVVPWMMTSIMSKFQPPATE